MWQDLDERDKGFALLSNNPLKVSCLETILHLIYEGTICKIKADSKELIIFGMYHLLASYNLVPNTLFANEFLDKLAKLLESHSDVRYIPAHDLSDADAVYLLEAMSSLSFDLVVKSVIHRHGNTINLLFSNEVSNTIVKKILVSDMMSDPRIVTC